MAGFADIAQVLQSYYYQTQNIVAMMHRQLAEVHVLFREFHSLSLRAFN